MSRLRGSGREPGHAVALVEGTAQQDVQRPGRGGRPPPRLVRQPQEDHGAQQRQQELHTGAERVCGLGTFAENCAYVATRSNYYS